MPLRIRWRLNPRYRRPSYWSSPISPFWSSKHRSTRHREKATSNILGTGVPAGALLTKNFNSAGFRTSRAMTRCSGSPGRPSASTGWNRRCLTSQTIGPLCPSLTRYRRQGWSRRRGSASIASTRRAGRLPLASRGTLRPRPRRCLWYGRVTTRGGSTQPMKFRGTSPTNFCAAGRQLAQELGLAAVTLVEGRPVEVQAVGGRVVVQFQGDLPLGPVDHVVGDARLATAVAVVGPGFGEEQLAVEQAVEAVAGVGEVDRDDAVLGLADGAAPLPLDARGLVPLLDVAGLVEDRDGVGPGMVVADDVLEPVAGLVVVPGVLAEERSRPDQAA